MKKVLFAVLCVALIAVLTVGILVGCNRTDKNKIVITQADVEEFCSTIYEWNLKNKAEVIAAGFDLPTTVEYKTAADSYVDFDIVWTITGGNGLATLTDAADGGKTLVVNKYANEETKFTLTGTVTYGDFTASLSKEFVIEPYIIASWDEWAEKTKDATMNIKGVVVGKYVYSPDYKNTSVYLQDLDGVHGYFAYRLKCDSQSAYDTDLAIGNVLEINGTTSIYNGFREMGAGCTYTVVKNADGSVMTATPAKIDFDKVMADAGENALAAIDAYQGVIGTFKGYQVKKLEWYKGDNTFTASRLSIIYTLAKGDDTFTIQFDTDYQASKADVQAAFAKIGLGYTVDVEAPLSWNKAPHMYPAVDAVTIVSTEVAAEDKIATELGKLSFVTATEEVYSADLPAVGSTYSDVTLAWEATGATAAIADGKLTLTPNSGSAEQVVVKVTATCGEASESKEYKIMVGTLTPEIIVNMAYDLETGKSMGFEVELTGVVTEVVTAYSTQYSNITVNLQIGDFSDKLIQAFRMKAADGVDITRLGKGDTVTVKGNIKNYNGTVEFDAGCIATAVEYKVRTAAEKIAETLEALSVVAAAEENTEITLAAKSADYDEVALAWELVGTPTTAVLADGKLTLTPANDKVEQVTVKVTATCGEATDSKEFKIMVGTLTPEIIVNMAYALETGKAMGFEVELTGVVTEVVTAYSTQYSNITVNLQIGDFSDKLIQAFRMKAADGVDITRLGKGDTVTVKGNIKNYNGTVEFDAGCIATAVEYKVRTAAEKIAETLEGLALTEAAEEAAEVTLAAKSADYGDVSLAWELVGTFTTAAIADGKLTLTPANDKVEQVIVKVTATCGETTDTKQFTIMVGTLTPEVIVNMAYALEGGKSMSFDVELTGVVTEVITAYDSKFGNITVNLKIGDMADKPIQAYRMLAADGVDITRLHAGDTVTVTGRIKNYKNTVEFDAKCVATAVVSYERTDADKIAEEFESLSLAASVTEAANIDLVAAGSYYTAVAFAWDFVGAHTTATIADGKLSITPAEDKVEQLTVKVTATCGEANDSKEFKIMVGTLTPEFIVNMAYALDKGANLGFDVELSGVVASIATAYSQQYSNVTVWMQIGDFTDKWIEAYRLVGDTNIDLSGIKVGDSITVKGSIKNYNGTVEFDAGCVATAYTANDTVPATVQVVLAAKAVVVAESVDEAGTINLPTAGATYTNVSFAWALADTTVASLDGAALSITPAEEDADISLTLTATMDGKSYQRTFTVTVVAVQLTEEEKLENLLKELYALDEDATKDNVTLTGAVVSVDTPYSSSNKNITVTIVAGSFDSYPVQCFRMAGDEGVDVSKLAVGDTITVTGTVTNYKGTIEFKQGCLATAVTLTDLGNANRELAVLTLPYYVTADSQLTLAAVGATYDTVAFAWSVEEGTATIADGKLNITIGAETATNVVKVVATCGEAEASKQFTVKAIVGDPSQEDIVRNAYTLANGSTIADMTLTGTITKVNKAYNSTKKNITVTIKVGDMTAYPIQCYNLQGATDVDISGLKVGDSITVTGTLKNFNGTIEFDAGCTCTINA